MPPDDTSSRALVPRHRTLDGVIEAMSQTAGIKLIDVDAFTTLVVRTDNSIYRITILKPHAREVLVQGGKFFPARTRACLSGSTFGGSCLKMGWVGLGLHLEFHATTVSAPGVHALLHRATLPETAAANRTARTDRGAPLVSFRVAIARASGIISGKSPDIPQEGPCAAGMACRAAKEVC